MGAFILIFYLSTANPQGGMTLTSVEFSNQPSCEAAAKEAKNKFASFFSHARYICVAKDTTR